MYRGAARGWMADQKGRPTSTVTPTGPPQSRWTVRDDSSSAAAQCSVGHPLVLQQWAQDPTHRTLPHHHHVIVPAVLRMIHHPHHTCSVVVLWGSCPLKNRVIQYTEKQMDYSLHLYTYRVSCTVPLLENADMEAPGHADLQTIKNHYQKASECLDAGFREDEAGNKARAVVLYRLGRRHLLQGLEMTTRRTQCVGADWDCIRQLQVKMNETLSIITTRLAVLENGSGASGAQALCPSLSVPQEPQRPARRPCVNSSSFTTASGGAPFLPASPVTTSDLPSELPPAYTPQPTDGHLSLSHSKGKAWPSPPRLKEMTRQQSFNDGGGDLMFLPHGVQIFFVAADGQVSAPSYPGYLRIVLNSSQHSDSSDVSGIGQPPAYLQVRAALWCFHVLGIPGPPQDHHRAGMMWVVVTPASDTLTHHHHVSVTAGLRNIHQPKLSSQQRPVGQRPVGQRPVGGALWGSVLWGSVLWAASCDHRPVGQRPVSTDEGLEDDQHCTVQQQVCDWHYPLFPDSPVLLSNTGVFTFPDTTAAEPGSYVGVVLSPELPAADRALFQEHLSVLTQLRVQAANDQEADEPTGTDIVNLNQKCPISPTDDTPTSLDTSDKEEKVLPEWSEKISQSILAVLSFSPHPGSTRGGWVLPSSLVPPEVSSFFLKGSTSGTDSATFSCVPNLEHEHPMSSNREQSSTVQQMDQVKTGNVGQIRVYLRIRWASPPRLKRDSSLKMTRRHSESLHDSLSCMVQPSADGAALTGGLMEDTTAPWWSVMVVLGQSGASWLSRGLVQGGEVTGKAIHKGATKLRENITPEETPAEVSPRVTRGLQVARQATGGAAKVSNLLVEGLATVVERVGKELAPHVKKHSSKLVPESLKKNKGACSNMDGAKAVAVSSIRGISTLWSGLETAAKTVGKSASSETVQTVKHKYGDEAGRATDTAVQSVVNVGNTAFTLDNIVLKAAVKTARRQTSTGVEGEEESVEPETTAKGKELEKK
ncbi:hypothetical protein NFI96_015255 [Prochilodus magdalenae]|nr:hypothetical protein NFI96_015255 [Prochilodus magdalenae]